MSAVDKVIERLRTLFRSNDVGGIGVVIARNDAGFICRFPDWSVVKTSSGKDAPEDIKKLMAMKSENGPTLLLRTEYSSDALDDVRDTLKFLYQLEDSMTEHVAMFVEVRKALLEDLEANGLNVEIRRHGEDSAPANITTIPDKTLN